jgi:hypothetical protein
LRDRQHLVGQRGDQHDVFVGGALEGAGAR